MKWNRGLVVILYATFAAATSVAGGRQISGKRSNPSAACFEAQQQLGEAVVDTLPLNQTVVELNWSQTCVQEPYCIISPTDAQHVSEAIKIIKSHNVKFATRSGGHSPNPGWSSIGKEGILIDMSKFNQVSLSGDGQVASIGPGLRWGQVTSVLEQQGAAVVGGRLPDVGVGGLILGGGYHHVSGQYGLAADNVHNFEIVLSDGSIKNANAQENEDLFWALKGGGPNFGIVTRYDLKTIPVGAIWCQLNIYAPGQALEVLDAFTEWQTNGASDLKSTIGLIMGLDTVTVGLLYFEPADQPEAFRPFYDLEPLQVAIPPTNATLSFLNEVLGGAFPFTPLRHDYRGISSRIDGNTTKEVYQHWVERALAVRESTGASQIFGIQHVPSELAKQGVAKGGNPLGIPEEDQLWWTTLVDWEDATQDDVVRSVSIETENYWLQLGEERGLRIPFLYMNDASRDQNPIATYGAENVNRLKQIAKKYDPTEFFQKLQYGGFLLSKA
ncbi:hypothetical protein DL768_005473 [Monosporascus sp. mg162]|nr:hypothetical protein DL768_005473 [Monosporascus sp. mg162]